MGNSPAKESTNTLSVPVVAAAAANTPAAAPGEKPKCKACCACPETKKARDQCIMENGEENCGTFIDAHKKCMRDMGFNV